MVGLEGKNNSFAIRFLDHFREEWQSVLAGRVEYGGPVSTKNQK